MLQPDAASDHSQSRHKALQQEATDGGKQNNPEQLEKNKVPHYTLEITGSFGLVV